MARKAVRTLSVTATSFTAPVISAPPFAGLSAEKTKIGAFGDKTFTNVVAEISEYQDIPIVLLDEGDTDFLIPGTQHAFTFGTGYSSGGETTITRTFTRDCQVVSLESTSVEVDGNRRSAVTLTIVPVGGDDPSSMGLGKGGAVGG